MVVVKKISEIESKRVEKKEWVGWRKTIEVCLMQETRLMEVWMKNIGAW
jgi:hypothetical protein